MPPRKGSGKPGLRTEDSLDLKREVSSEQWQETEDDEEPALYATDDFRIRVMKVLLCSKKYCHDWTRCPFAHPGEKATRRDPMSGVYTGIACPDMRRDQRCPRGHYCPYAHNVFEYWLHPTRYRTALCRDVDRCTRKICFFAHNMQEIRTNLERPYVSPEQLLAATQAAAADPRVQAKYLAAGEQKGPTRNIFSGIDDDDVGRPLDSLLPLQSLSNLTLAAPPSTSQRAETMNAFSSMIRGSSESVAQLRPQAAQPQRDSDTGVFGRGAAQGAQPVGETALGSGLGIDVRHEENEQPNTPHVDQSFLSSAKPVQARPVRSPSTAGPIHSWGSQQNLLNAAAHLSNDKAGNEASLWSTPRGPLDMNALHSTASTASERNMSIDSSNRSLDMRFGQRIRRGKPARRQSNTSIGQVSQSGTFSGSGTMTGASYPGQSLYTASSGSTFGLAPDTGLNQYSGLYHDSLNSQSLQSDYAQMLQRDQQAFQQQHQNFLGMPQQTAQSVYEQQLRARLQNTLNQGLGNPLPPVPLAEELRRRELAAQAAMPETGFDLRFGGLGENQGLLTQTGMNNQAGSGNLYSDLTNLYSVPDNQLQQYLQSDVAIPRFQQPASQSYPGSFNSSILQTLQAHGLRTGEDAMSAPKRHSTEGALPSDVDFAARMGFGSAAYGRSPPRQ